MLADRFEAELAVLEEKLARAKRVLVTSPGAADGDSIGAQLALRRMLLHRYPQLEIHIVNDEPLPARYRFLPDVALVETPESFAGAGKWPAFDVAIIVDGGIDRAGRVREPFDRAPFQVFIDHHAVSIEYPYSLRIVDADASATTEIIYHLCQSPRFRTPVGPELAQQIYLGLVFDTGFFRHSSTTPESMELAALLLRAGFDFTRVGERGMLERTFAGLQLLADTLARAKLAAGGKIIWSALLQERLKHFGALEDEREGIIDHLFLTQGIQVAVFFVELAGGNTKVSFRSQGKLDVARFARGLTEHGGGHVKAAGALLELPMARAIELVLAKLETQLRD